MGEVSDPGRKPRPNPVRVEFRVYDAYRRHNYEPIGDVCITVSAFFGTGGGNIPIVVEYGKDICREEIFQMARGRDSGITP